MREDRLTTKEWLKRAQKIEEELWALDLAKQAAYERCTSTTSKPKEIQVSSGGGQSGDSALAAYVALAEKIDKLTAKQIEIKLEIIDVICKVEDRTLRILLTRRYINFDKWKEIAHDMHYSYRHICSRLHPEALRRVDRIRQAKEKGKS